MPYIVKKGREKIAALSPEVYTVGEITYLLFKELVKYHNAGDRKFIDRINILDALELLYIVIMTGDPPDPILEEDIIDVLKDKIMPLIIRLRAEKGVPILQLRKAVLATKVEYIRRYLFPYEEKKLQENGDV